MRRWRTSGERSVISIQVETIKLDQRHIHIRCRSRDRWRYRRKKGFSVLTVKSDCNNIFPSHSVDEVETGRMSSKPKQIDNDLQ